MTFAAIAGLLDSDTMNGADGDSDFDHEDSSLEESSLPANPSKGRLEKNRMTATGLSEDVFSLKNGQSVVVQWPERMDPALAEDVQDWLKIIGRKISRAFAEPPEDDHEASVVLTQYADELAAATAAPESV